MNQLFVFLTFIVGWSAACSLALGAVHPIAVFVVWIIVFVWGSAYIAAGKRAADHLTKRWLQLLIGIAIVGGTIALSLS